MSFAEYIAARNILISFGKPLMDYILIIAFLQGFLSILYFKKKDIYKYLLKILHVQTSLYILGFLFLIWYHIKIYNTILIEYPIMIRQIIPIESSRLTVPLWIENEKIYFLTLVTLIFTLLIKEKNIVSLTSLIISVLSIITYFLSNPFQNPLPQLNKEIEIWYISLNSQAIYQISYSFYARITYFYNSVYMWVHPPMLFIAYASLIITFVGCVYMIFKKDGIYDEIAYRYAKIGYILLTIGMLIGYPWAIEAWKNSAWWWDPKISGSIMMWSLYTAYLHLHIYTKKIWKTTAIIGILCFISLIFTYSLTYIVPGIHSIRS